MRATTSFEEALESSLQELAHSGDVESCLRRHPGHAEQLRPLLETVATLRGHFRVVPPAPGGLLAGRERFLAVAAQERARPASQASDAGQRVRMGGRRLRLSFARLFPVLLVALLGAAILGGGVAWAASGSLPGELLYPVKLATEDVRLALTSTPQGQVDLALDLVEQRAQEIESLAQAGGQVPDDTVARLEQHIQRALTRSASASDEALDGLLLQVAERTGTQAQRLERVQASAAVQLQLGLQRAVAACWRGAAEAEAGLADPQTFRWRYRHREGEPEPTQEPQQEQERHQEQNREREGQPTYAPHATPHGPQGESRPAVTPQRLRVTATPSLTPTATVSSTLEMPRATAEPQPTSQGPRSTAGPQPTSQGPGSTAGPQPTSQGPHSTSGPQPTSQGPQATAEPEATSAPSPPHGPQPTAVPPSQDPPATSEPGQPGAGPGGGP